MEGNIRQLIYSITVTTLIHVIPAVSSKGDVKTELIPLVPEFVEMQKNFTFNKGELAILYCSVENLGTKTVIWRRVHEKNPLTIGEYTYVNDDRINVGHRKGSSNWNLLIKNVQPHDSGIYECQISTKEKDIRQQIFLDVKEEDPINRKPDIQIYGNPYVVKGDTIYLTCNATGTSNPPDTVDWFKGGHKVVTDSDQKIFVKKDVSLKSKTIGSTLRIRHARMQDTGTYICRTSDLQITKLQVNVLNDLSNINKRADLESGEPSPSSSGYSGASRVSANCFMSNIRLLITLLLMTILHEGMQFRIK
ncbi:hypothetical protein ScPMuIL_018379 [Solemya velum]